MSDKIFELPSDTYIKLPICPDSMNMEKLAINKGQYLDAVEYSLFIYRNRIYTGYDTKEENHSGRKMIGFREISNFGIEVM